MASWSTPATLVAVVEALEHRTRVTAGSVRSRYASSRRVSKFDSGVSHSQQYGKHAVPSYIEALVVELLERPHDRLHVGEVHCLVVVLEVDPAGSAVTVLSHSPVNA